MYYCTPSLQLLGEGRNGRTKDSRDGEGAWSRGLPRSERTTDDGCSASAAEFQRTGRLPAPQWARPRARLRQGIHRRILPTNRAQEESGQDTDRRRVPSRCWPVGRSEEHTSELQSQSNLVCRLLLEKKKSFVSPTPAHLNRVSHTNRLQLNP